MDSIPVDYDVWFSKFPSLISAKISPPTWHSTNQAIAAPIAQFPLDPHGSVLPWSEPIGDNNDQGTHHPPVHPSAMIFSPSLSFHLMKNPQQHLLISTFNTDRSYVTWRNLLGYIKQRLQWQWWWWHPPIQHTHLLSHHLHPTDEKSTIALLSYFDQSLPWWQWHIPPSTSTRFAYPSPVLPHPSQPSYPNHPTESPLISTILTVRSSTACRRLAGCSLHCCRHSKGCSPQWQQHKSCHMLEDGLYDFWMNNTIDKTK